jgi:xanthine dehydrogenase accessory factor
VLASIDGVIRGLIREIPVFAGRKLGDIDPRGEVAYCYSISDKARAIAGGVLKAVAGWALRLSMEEEHG